MATNKPLNHISQEYKNSASAMEALNHLTGRELVPVWTKA